jgi:hypothetical protein
MVDKSAYEWCCGSKCNYCLNTINTCHEPNRYTERAKCAISGPEKTRTLLISDIKCNFTVRVLDVITFEGFWGPYSYKFPHPPFLNEFESEAQRFRMWLLSYGQLQEVNNDGI